MVDRELQAEEKNLEASVAFLREETQREAALLSKTIAKKKTAEAAARSAETRLRAAESRLEAVQATHEGVKAATVALRRSRNAEKAVHTETLAELRNEAHNANLTLNSLGHDIESLTVIKNTLLSELSSLEGQLTERSKVLADIEDLRTELFSISARRDALQSELSTIAAEGELALRARIADLDHLQERIDVALSALADAESEKKVIDDECQRKKADLAIAVDRIEAKYQKAFPGLRLLLA
jgi:chromosome segregation ATPase